MRIPATLAGALALIGCGGGGGHRPSRVEAALARELGATLGMPVERVACQKASCVATVAGVVIPITIREDAGAGQAWEIAGLVVTAPVLETQVAGLLAELDVKAHVDCGPRVQVVTAGARVSCAISGAMRDGASVIDGGDHGRAFATIDAEGDADIDIALGDAAVAARVEEVGDRAGAAAAADLDKLSRALDREGEGGGEDDDGEGSGNGTGNGNGSGQGSGSGSGNGNGSGSGSGNGNGSGSGSGSGGG